MDQLYEYNADRSKMLLDNSVPIPIGPADTIIKIILIFIIGYVRKVNCHKFYIYLLDKFPPKVTLSPLLKALTASSVLRTTTKSVTSIPPCAPNPTPTTPIQDGADQVPFEVL